jgi:hypothetical protein
MMIIIIISFSSPVSLLLVVVVVVVVPLPLQCNAMQSLVDLSLFQNCPPLLSVLHLTSPVPYTVFLYLPQLMQAI